MLKRSLKIGFSVLFVGLVAFAVVRSCAPHKKASDRLELGGRAPVKKVRIAVPGEKPPVREAALMAVILDDWGRNAALLKDAIAIRRPLTVAVLPGLPYSRAIAQDAHRAGLAVMLHMPMQPFNDKEPLEAHTILTTTSDDQIRDYLDTALTGVPFVEGVNNHMGSAATSDVRVMRTVLTHLKAKGYFFIDSNVTPRSKAPVIARETGIRFAKRDVFIDNDPKTESVVAQLRRAKDIALKRGRVVVIGHDKRATLAALRSVIDEFEKAGIRFVYARELLRA